MSFFENMKNLLGIGPLLLFVGVAIEGIAIYFNQWISVPIVLSFNLQIMLTIPLVALFLSGMAWFNFSLNLIKVNFRGGENRLVIHGPFYYVRHPLYAILILTLPLLAVVWFADLLFAIPWILIIFGAHFLVLLEEKELVDQFGESYKKYRHYVPALIPYKGANGKRYYPEIITDVAENK